jgi:spoIIIJ-associated protein
MEWVETTGRTVEAAKEAALDQLGVDEGDAEFEVVTEPRPGLFGRLRGEARVRARVRPTKPRAKERSRDSRRQRRHSPADGGGGASAGPATSTEVGESGAGTGDSRQEAQRDRRGGRDGGENAAQSQAVGAGSAPRERPRRRRGTRTSEDTTGVSAGHGVPDIAAGPDRHRPQEEDRQVEVALEEQAAVAKDFLDGLVAEIGLPADVAVGPVDDDTVELAIDGQDLGVLIGQRGSTLLALQDLTRTVVQRRTGASNGRLLVDVAGYRRKRQEALARFAHQVAAQVKSEGRSKALEPMSAADRKVVHDTVNAIEGVSTTSEGEEPRRYVVVLPQSQS